METLFFLIVLAIIIFSNVANVRKKMKSAQGDSSSAPGWKKSLKEMVDQIKAELEKASGESSRQPRRPSGWEDLLGAGRQAPPAGEHEPWPEARPTGPRPRMETKAPPRMETKEPPRIETKEPPRMERKRETLLERLEKRPGISEAREAERRAKAEGPPAGDYPPLGRPAEPAARQPAFGKRAYSVAELRNAVIWYEILSPPVALRPEGQKTWE